MGFIRWIVKAYAGLSGLSLIAIAILSFLVHRGTLHVNKELQDTLTHVYNIATPWVNHWFNTNSNTIDLVYGILMILCAVCFFAFAISNSKVMNILFILFGVFFVFFLPLGLVYGICTIVAGSILLLTPRP